MRAIEKCIWHPWATEDSGMCWKCEEEIRQEQFIYYMEQYNQSLRKDSITEAVILDLRLRSKRGIVKYDTTLEENNHQNMLQHAYEEALDLAQYLKKEITILNTIQDLVKKHNDDQELGKTVREIYSGK